MRIGTKVLWAAACDEIPIIWTSLSTASWAASSGVWNKGPTSTSKPISANAVAMTFAPLSCPSCPSLITNILGLLPSFFSKSYTLFWIFKKLSSFS